MNSICSDLTLKWTRSWHLGRPRLQIPQLTSAWNRGFSLAQQAHIYHPDPELNLGSSLLSVLVFLCSGQWEKSFYLRDMCIKHLFVCLSQLSFAGVKMQSNSLQPYPWMCPSLHCASVKVSSLPLGRGVRPLAEASNPSPPNTWQGCAGLQSPPQLSSACEQPWSCLHTWAPPHLVGLWEWIASTCYQWVWQLKSSSSSSAVWVLLGRQRLRGRVGLMLVWW